MCNSTSTIMSAHEAVPSLAIRSITQIILDGHCHSDCHNGHGTDEDLATNWSAENV